MKEIKYIETDTELTNIVPKYIYLRDYYKKTQPNGNLSSKQLGYNKYF